MSGLIKAAKIAAWAVLLLITLFLVWGNLIAWAKVFSPRWSVILISVAVILSLLTARFITSREFRKILRDIKEKIATMGVAYTFDTIVNWLFNYPLYIFVIANWGKYIGGGIMIVLSFFACLTYIVIYDWLKRDIFGLEMAKGLVEEWKEYQGKNFWRSLLARFLKRWGDAGIFIALSILKDPFYTVAVCRKEVAKYNGLSKRDWKIFLGSVALGNVPWILTVSGVVWIWELDFNVIWPYFERGFFWIISRAVN
jgi:hypothetical protein